MNVNLRTFQEHFAVPVRGEVVDLDHVAQDLRTPDHVLHSIVMLAGLGSFARICVSAPKFTRTLVDKSALRSVPKPRIFPKQVGKFVLPLDVSTPREFLKAIGRSSEKQLQPESWDALWKMSGKDMREAGIAVRDRRSVTSFCNFHVQF